MSNKLDELRQNVANLFNNSEDKTIIQNVGVINKLIDDIAEEHSKQESDYKELLHDYKEVVVHSSFKPTGNESQIPEQKEFSFESCLEKFAKEKLNK